ncbi:MAG: hypothetical protein LH654_09255, partial [Thermoleophilia bacterium]|nr:hypothetical protein [Thermoleophilia bacterium]
MAGIDDDVLGLFPDSARIEGADLTIGGLTTDEHPAELATPLLVYSEETLRAQTHIHITAP